MFNMIFDLLCKRIENLEQKVNDYEKRIADLEVQVQSQQEVDLDKLVTYISVQLGNQLEKSTNEQAFVKACDEIKSQYHD